jgi:hypothetical protein
MSIHVPVATAVLIGALALAVVLFFADAIPDDPLTPLDTSFVVGACATLVLSVRWLRRRSGGADE